MKAYLAGKNELNRLVSHGKGQITSMGWIGWVGHNQVYLNTTHMSEGPAGSWILADFQLA